MPRSSDNAALAQARRIYGAAPGHRLGIVISTGPGLNVKVLVHLGRRNERELDLSLARQCHITNHHRGQRYGCTAELAYPDLSASAEDRRGRLRLPQTPPTMPRPDTIVVVHYDFNSDQRPRQPRNEAPWGVVATPLV